MAAATGGIARSMPTATDGVPTETVLTPLDDRYVSIKLSEIQRIRDVLMRLRNQNSINRALWQQVAGLYQRLSTQKETTTCR